MALNHVKGAGLILNELDKPSHISQELWEVLPDHLKEGYVKQGYGVVKMKDGQIIGTYAVHPQSADSSDK